MKNISEFLNECLTIVEAEETIKSEKEFRAAAKAKFEEVFGDELDEEKMNKFTNDFKSSPFVIMAPLSDSIYKLSL